MVDHGLPIAIINVNCEKIVKKKKGQLRWPGSKNKRIPVSLTFNTATAMQERSDVPFNCTRAHQLVADQICVVGG